MGSTTKSSLNKTPLRLEERDQSLLCDLFTHGAMLRSQVQALHFPSLRRCNRRLHQLFLAGCVARTALPLGTQAAWLSGKENRNETEMKGRAAGENAAGFGNQYVYRLGTGGAAPVARHLGWDEADVRRLLRPGTPLYLAHALEGVRFRLLLTRATAAGNTRLLRFLPERLLPHAYEVRETDRAGAAWRREVFKPDAYFELTATCDHTPVATPGMPVGIKLLRFFVEIDLGHTSAREFSAKVRIHRRYRDSGLFARRYGGVDFRTLVCTTSAARRDNLRRVVEREETDLFWLTTLAEMEHPGPLAPVWHVPFCAEPLGLLPEMNSSCDPHDFVTGVAS